MTDFVVRPGQRLQGRLRVPGDKSMSHRAVMFAALAEGRSSISGFLPGEDTVATLNIFRQLGVDARRDDDSLVIQGVGLQGLKGADGPLDCGNSGTGMRLLAGLLAGQRFPSLLLGDESLMQRPMKRVAVPLRQMGADMELAHQGRPPIRIRPVEGLQGIEYTLPVASAQVKSAVLLAGLYARGETTVVEPRPTRDHTERMLQAFGCPVHVQGARVSLSAPEGLQARDFTVPADISSAAFWLVAASIVPGSDLWLEGVGVNPRRDGIVHLLQAMGADIEIHPRGQADAGEPVADLRVRHAALRGIDVPPALIANAIDEFPVWFVAAALADGESLLRGAQELRVKESDRLAVMAQGLRAMGVELEEFDDGIRIAGGAALQPATVHSAGDHRCAMAFAVAGLAGRGCRVQDCDNVNTSYPGFVLQAQAVGADVEAVP